MIKVLIADDQEVIREGIKLIIEQDNDIKVVGCVENGREAYEACGRLFPNIVLMDLVMPFCDGIEGTELIKSKYDSIKVVILTTFCDMSKVSKAFEKGVDGYVQKDITSNELRLLIKSTVNGLKTIHPNVFNTIKNHFDMSSFENDIEQSYTDVGFTCRELSVIRLIAFGKSNKEIASTLFISEGRVKNVVTKILEKLHMKDRTQLAIYAIKNRII